MAGFFSRDSNCDRARVWASLGLDGELSELERGLLQAHLDRCEQCASFAAGVESLTKALRTASLEVPERTLAAPARPGSVSRRRLAVQGALAASLAGLALGLGVLAGPLTRGSDEPAPRLSEDVVLVTPISANQLGEEGRLRGARANREEPFLPARDVRGNL